MRATLAYGETTTYTTVNGGLVVVSVAADSPANGPRCYEAQCKVCYQSSPADRTKLVKVSEWAREHAAACTALPEDYTDARDAAFKHAAKASWLLAQVESGNADPDRLMPPIDVHTRLAAIYADLARTQR